jgi:anti-sigma factor RsiW
VKQQLPPTSHERHDPLLIARFYGGDVDERERERAVALVAACEECAALYADLEAIADATRLLPTPPRPRDFTITETDAARLTRRRGRTGLAARLGWPGVRRSLGGVLTAVGLVGVLAAGTASLLGPAASPHEARFVYDAGTAAPANDQQGGAMENGATARPEIALGSPGPTTQSGAVGAGASANPADLGGKTAAASPAAGATPPNGVTGGDTATAGGANAGGTPGGEQLGPASVGSTPPGESTDQTSKSASPLGGSGPDAGLLALLAFGLALLLGLALLVGPAAMRFAGRRTGP